MITVKLKYADYEAIVAHARAALPNEACGLIAGNVVNDIKTIDKIYLLSNPDNSPEHFSIDPKEQLTAIKDMRSLGIVPLGNFHSHPATPARPSAEDIRLSYDPKASYLILSLAEEPPALKAFGVIGGAVAAQTLEIV
jgi:proteasome lid subunit RPN8/RPN11